MEDIDTRRFTGPLSRPGDIGYDVERKGFNVSSDRPALVVGASGPADVVAAVECAATAGRAVGVVDVSISPARHTRIAEGLDGEWGMTVRFCDPTIGPFRSTWHGPARKPAARHLAPPRR